MREIFIIGMRLIFTGRCGCVTQWRDCCDRTGVVCKIKGSHTNTIKYLDTVLSLQICKVGRFARQSVYTARDWRDVGCHIAATGSDLHLNHFSRQMALGKK